MLIEGIDYLIRLTGGLGSKVKGFVCEDADGHYNIYVNKNHTREQQMQTIRHELEHIEKADMESSTPADQLENKRHGFCIMKKVERK